MDVVGMKLFPVIVSKFYISNESLISKGDIRDHLHVFKY
jgi:hypothetical protein